MPAALSQLPMFPLYFECRNSVLLWEEARIEHYYNFGEDDAFILLDFFLIFTGKLTICLSSHHEDAQLKHS
jgi:hypothetical protein